MPATTNVERLADHFVTYLFHEFQGTRHVRRVATWIGFVLKSIDRASGSSMVLSRKRQVIFRFHGRDFKARYSHKVGSRGGIEILQYYRQQGSPDGKVVLQISTLAEAEDAYRNLEKYLTVSTAT